MEYGLVSLAAARLLPVAPAPRFEPGIIIVALAAIFGVRPGWPLSGGQFSGSRW
jgi:hypothetical protein